MGQVTSLSVAIQAAETPTQFTPDKRAMPLCQVPTPSLQNCDKYAWPQARATTLIFLQC